MRVAAVLACVLSAGLAGPAWAYTAYVSNEGANTVSVVDLDAAKVVHTIDVGQRPRGITITPDGKYVFLCASDDDTIQIIDTATLKVVGELPSGPDPETFALGPKGEYLYVSNENDALVTVIDVATRKAIAQVPTGVEPEGMAVSPDGQTIVNTSETTNMAHFMDFKSRKMVANVLVDPRPRAAVFTPDGSEVWVTSELGGSATVIDAKTHTIKAHIRFAVQGLRSDVIQAVGIRITDDGKTAFVALGPGQPRGGDRRQDLQGREIPAGRPARLAIGLHPGRQIPAVHQRPVQRHLGDQRGRSARRPLDPGRQAAVGRGRVAKVTSDSALLAGVQTAPGTRAEAELVAALAVERVSHRYGTRQALSEVSLTVPQARFVALLGPNGAGKTTLFSLITRLYDTQSGSIRVLGHAVSRAPGEALRRLGVVFQARTLDLDLSLMDNLLYHAALQGIPRAQAKPRAAAVLADVELADRAREKARQLSGGQMRRVEIARALLHRPRLLVLDEPTVGLDVSSKWSILSYVRRLAREQGVAVLWATHLLDEVEPEDQVVVLHRGQVRMTASAAEIVQRTGAADLRGAFTQLTDGGASAGAEVT